MESELLPSTGQVTAHRNLFTNLSITVTIKAGTRQEDLDNSSVSQFISRLALKGTSKFSKEEIERKIDSFGGNVEVTVTRELTQFSLMFDKSQIN
jgi:predicted Zn-dependent peptidase